jgi:hypothetical protein
VVIIDEYSHQGNSKEKLTDLICSAGIKKGWPIIVQARPFEADIQARVLLYILDLQVGHVVLTLGATGLFIGEHLHLSAVRDIL